MKEVKLFFFQAEDGIRDTSVTGVQTCALPICGHRWSRFHLFITPVRLSPPRRTRRNIESYLPFPTRSEERRVGKECRDQWLWSEYRKNIQDLKEVKS